MSVIESPSLIVERPDFAAMGHTGGDANDCTIRATMAVTGLKYALVRSAFIKTDHKDRAKTLGSLQKYLIKFDDTAPLLVYTKAHVTAFVNTRCIEWLPPRKRIWYSGTGRLVKI